MWTVASDLFFLSFFSIVVCMYSVCKACSQTESDIKLTNSIYIMMR